MINLPEWSKVYFPNGVAVKQGDLVKRPTLADTLEIIATKGVNEFYQGDIAKSLVETIQAAGGIATLEDFQSYQPVIRHTLSTYYNGRKVTTCSEPTSGPVLLSVLNLIERFQFKVDGFIGLNLHRFVEAFKFGYAFRTEMGDPDFTHNEERVNEITTKDYASEIRQRITVSIVGYKNNIKEAYRCYRITLRMNRCIITQNLTMLSLMGLCISLL